MYNIWYTTHTDTVCLCLTLGKRCLFFVFGISELQNVFIDIFLTEYWLDESTRAHKQNGISYLSSLNSIYVQFSLIRCLYVSLYIWGWKYDLFCNDDFSRGGSEVCEKRWRQAFSLKSQCVICLLYYYFEWHHFLYWIKNINISHLPILIYALSFYLYISNFRRLLRTNGNRSQKNGIYIKINCFAYKWKWENPLAAERKENKEKIREIKKSNSQQSSSSSLSLFHFSA